MSKLKYPSSAAPKLFGTRNQFCGRQVFPWTWGGEVSGWFKYITFDCALRLPCGSEGKASACNAGDLALIPGLGRSPGEGNGSPLQYSCLGNPMDREVWQATVHWVTKKSDTTQQLNNKNNHPRRQWSCLQHSGRSQGPTNCPLAAKQQGFFSKKD